MDDIDLDLFDFSNRRVKEMQKAFDTFDQANPTIWFLFRRFADEAIGAGRKALSASMIVERIRWEELVTTTSEDGYKINNNFRAFYSRKFMTLYPAHAGIFRTRKAAADESC